MTALLNILFSRTLLFPGVALLLLWGVGYWQFTSGQADANLRWSVKWAQRDAAEHEARTRQEVRARKEELRRQHVIQEEQKYANEQLANAQSSAADAEHAANGLRSQLSALRRQLAGSETSKLSAASSASAANAQTVLMFTQLLRESDEMAGKFAAQADRAYIAGKACEDIYRRISSPPGIH